MVDEPEDFPLDLNWEDDAYEIDDPKHPDYHDNWSDYADSYGDPEC